MLRSVHSATMLGHSRTASTNLYVVCKSYVIYFPILEMYEFLRTICVSNLHLKNSSHSIASSKVRHCILTVTMYALCIAGAGLVSVGWDSH